MKDNYVFTKDDHCISLYKRGIIKDKDSKKFGQEVDKLVGHYNNVEGVVKKLVHLELIESGTVKDLLIDLRKVNEDVSKLIQESLKLEFIQC